MKRSYKSIEAYCSFDGDKVLFGGLDNIVRYLLEKFDFIDSSHYILCKFWVRELINGEIFKFSIYYSVYLILMMIVFLQRQLIRFGGRYPRRLKYINGITQR